MLRPIFRLPAKKILLALILMSIPLAAGAKEESKMKIRLAASSGNQNGNGNGVGHGEQRADVATHMRGATALLKLKARGLDADTDYVLLGKNAEDATQSVLIARFTTASNGTAKLTRDLTGDGDGQEPIDPRGRYLVIAEAADESMKILGGWLYGEQPDDEPKTKIKEGTQLEPSDESSPTGVVGARYRMGPNGKARLLISARGVPKGDYEILIGGMEVATFTPNPSGSAKVDFRTHLSNGNGSGKVKPHRKKQALDFDPRRKQILIQLTDGTPMFSGPLIAQIDGLNVCTPSVTDTPLPGVVGSGVAGLESEASCETVFDVEIEGVVAGEYDLYADDLLVATIDASMDDGLGTISGSVRFDPTPDAGEDEMLLDFPVGSGSQIKIFPMGADPSGTPALSGTLL